MLGMRIDKISKGSQCISLEIGRTTISLKEAKQTVEDPVKFSSHCPLTQSKKDCGELLFGLSYLPTAQRLSFSLVKITSIKVDKNSDESISKFAQVLFTVGSKKKRNNLKITTLGQEPESTIHYTWTGLSIKRPT